MIVVIRDFEAPSKAGAVKDGSSRLKMVCLYSNEGTSGEIRRAVQPHETTVSTLSQQFGQHLQLGYQSVLTQYALAQICQVYLETVQLRMQNEADDSESGSSFGSRSDSDMSDSCQSLSLASKSERRRGNVIIGRLQAHPIAIESYKRRVVMRDRKPVVLTASILVCAEA